MNWLAFVRFFVGQLYWICLVPYCRTSRGCRSLEVKLCVFCGCLSIASFPALLNVAQLLRFGLIQHLIHEVSLSVTAFFLSLVILYCIRHANFLKNDGTDKKNEWNFSNSLLIQHQNLCYLSVRVSQIKMGNVHVHPPQKSTFSSGFMGLS